jgi:hypothetical protein
MVKKTLDSADTIVLDTEDLLIKNEAHLDLVSRAIIIYSTLKLSNRLHG